MAKEIQATPIFVPFGHGIQAAVVGDHLVLHINISEQARKTAPLSSTHKSYLLGNSGGMVMVPGLDGFKANVSVTMPNLKYDPATAPPARR